VSLGRESVVGPARAVRPGRVGAALGDYLALVKPRVLALLLFTAFAAMVLASGGFPSAVLLIAVMAGGTMAAGGANAINQWFERDIDGRMERTRRRPVPSGRVGGRRALLFGLALIAASQPVFAAGANLAAAGLALCGSLAYIFVYTVWLKRSSPLNVVIGAAAGAVPPLVGWAAVTGGLGAGAWCLSGIVLLWTPPHLWSLALVTRSDYARARVPMLPVVAGEAWTARAVLAYAAALVPLTLAFTAAVPSLGPLYSACAAGLGGMFVALAAALAWRPSPAAAFRLFKYSGLYLALLCVAAVIDGSIV